MATETSQKSKNSPRRKRGWGKPLLGIAIVLVLLLVVGVLALPSIIAAEARGRIESGVSQLIAGSVEVDKITISLFSGQAIGDVRLLDTDGSIIATTRASVEASLLRLIRGNLDLGEIRVAGAADLVRDTNGVLNLQRAIAPTGVSAGSPPPVPVPGASQPTATSALKLPDSLAATLVLDDLNVTYTDATLAEATNNEIGVYALRDFGGTITLRVGQPITGTLRGLNLSGPTRDTLTQDGETVLTIDLRDWSAADGTVTPDQIVGSGSLAAQTRNAGVEAALTFQDGVITTTSPATATLEMQPWSQRLVAVQAALQDTPGLTIERFPDIAVTLDQLRIELPQAGQAFDARRAQARASLNIGPLSGSADPGAMGLEGAARLPFATETTTATLVLTEQQTAEIRAAGSALVGEQSAGKLDVSFDLGELFDGAGTPQMPRKIVGGAKLDGVATAILDPFLAAVLSKEGQPLLRLTDDLGPTIDLSLTANSGTAIDASQAPPIMLKGSLQAAKVQGLLDLTLTDGVITSPPTTGLKLTMSDPGALFNRLAEGVTINRAAPIELTVSRVFVDTSALMASENPDLRHAGLMLTLNSGIVSGTLPNEQGAPRPFAAGPLQTRLDATSLREGRASLAINTGGSIDGQSAGQVVVQADTNRLLNEAGWIDLVTMPQVNAEAKITNLSTELLTALAGEALGPIDLQRDVGPTADLVLTITNPSAEELHADLNISSRDVRVVAPISVTAQRVASRSAITLTHTNPLELLNALAQAQPPLTGSVAGERPVLRAQIDTLLLPLDENTAPQIAQTHAKATVTIGGIASDTLVLTSLNTHVEVLADSGATIQSNLAMTHNGTAFTGLIDAKVDKLFSDAGEVLEPMAMNPNGRVELRGIPAALMQIFPETVRYIGEGPDRLDLAALADDLTGSPINATIALQGQQQAKNMNIAVVSTRTKLNADAALNGTQLAVSKLDFETRINNPATQRIFTLAGVEQARIPALLEPAVIQLAASRFEIPLNADFTPNAEAATGNLSLTGSIVASVRNLAPGTPADGPYHLNDTGFSLNAPLATLLGAKPGTAVVRTSGKITTPQNQTGTFEVTAEPRLADSALAGAFPIKATLDNLPVAFIDGLMGQPGMVAGAVGPTLGLDLEANVESGGDAPLRSVSLGIRSQRVNTSRPLTIAATGDTLRLTQPAELRVVLDPAWANRYLLGADAGPGAPPPLMLLTSQTNATLAMRQLVLPAQMGGTPEVPGGPMKLGVFSIDATVDLPQVAMVVSEARTPVTMSGASLALRPTNIPNATLDYDLRVREWTASGQRSNPQQPSRVWGTLFGIATPTGVIAAENANATGSFDLPGVPTALVDAFARTDLPSKALGDTVSAKGWYREISSVAGAFFFEATSPNATAQAEGFYRDGYLMVTKRPDGGATATISRITPALTADLAKALPLLQTIEKTAADEPARLILTTNVAVPIDGNMNNLGGYFTMEMGTARFAMREQFLGILRIPGLQRQGEVGRRLEPLHIVMDRGVIAYQPYSLPVGEFSFLLVGAVNLSDRNWESSGLNLRAGPNSIDAITYIPAGAVATEAIGSLGLPGGLGPQIMVPFRSRGPIDNPRMQVDLGLMARETLRPENILQGAGDLLGEPGRLLNDLIGGGRRR